MTAPDIDELAALAAKATPGPWIKAPSSTPHWHRVTDKRHNISVAVCGIENDAALIAAAVNALPALIARVRELERERDAAATAMRERCAQACEHIARAQVGASANRARAAFDCAAAIRRSAEGLR